HTLARITGSPLPLDETLGPGHRCPVEAELDLAQRPEPLDHEICQRADAGQLVVVLNLVHRRRSYTPSPPANGPEIVPRRCASRPVARAARDCTPGRPRSGTTPTCDAETATMAGYTGTRDQGGPGHHGP